MRLFAMTTGRHGDHCSDRALAARLTRYATAIVVGGTCLLVAAASQAQHFQPQPLLSIPVGVASGPNSFALVDVNNDHKLDLVAILQDDDEVAVLLGDGNGGFAALNDGVNTYDLSNVVTPTALAVADLGSPAGAPDGFPDIVVTGDDGSADILLGNGDGTLGSADDSQDISDEFLGDANDLEGIVLTNFDSTDRAPDLALVDVGDNDDSRVFLLCNHGGSFSTCGTSDGSPVEAGGNINPVDMQSGDFDGDGNTDLVVLSQGDTSTPGTFSVLYGDGQGNFTVSPQFSATAGGEDAVPWALAVANLDPAVNGNTRDDVVVTNASTFDDTNVAIALSQRRSQFTVSPASIEFNSRSAVALGDVRGDGHTDVAFASIPVEPSQAGPFLLLNDGVGNFSTSSFTAPGTERVGPGRAIRLADVGGDDLPDIVMVTDDGENVVVAINDSLAATVTPAPTFTPAFPTTGPTGTPTGTPAQSATPTPGGFGLSSGCSISDPAGQPPLGAGVLLALLALGGWRQRLSRSASASRRRSGSGAGALCNDQRSER